MIPALLSNRRVWRPQASGFLLLRTARCGVLPTRRAMAIFGQLDLTVRIACPQFRQTLPLILAKIEFP
jgi:hypothetical protein